MLSRQQATHTTGQSDDHRHTALPATHVTHFGRLVDDFVHCTGDKIQIHQLDHRPHAGQGRAHTYPNDASLSDRSFKDTAGEPFGDTVGHLVRSAVSDHVFPDHEYRVIPGHLFVQALPQCLIKCQSPHHATSLATTSVATSSAVGQGLSSANLTAAAISAAASA